MNPQSSNRSSLNAVLAVALAGAILAVPTLARAGDDDGVAPDIKFLRGILEGIGLKRGDEAPIKYGERAPLVIPPNDDLPPPQKPGAAIANNPAWPKDPDVARAKAMAKQEEQQYRDPQEQWRHDNNALLPDQLAPGLKKGRKTAARDNEPANPSMSKNGSYKLTPSELGFHGGLLKMMFGKKDDSRTAQFTGEPQRTSLTEPPPGYQTPSPNQPYGVGKEKYKPKAENYYLEHGTKQGN